MEVVLNIIDAIKEKQLCWYGHLCQMSLDVALNPRAMGRLWRDVVYAVMGSQGLCLMD